MPQIQLDATLFATAFVTVLVVMDPLGSVTTFRSLTRRQTLASAVESWVRTGVS